MAASLQLLLGDSSDGGGESGTCSCSSNGDGGSAGGSASQQSVDRAQMAVQLCTAWSLCLSVAEQLVAPRPHDDSSSSHSGGGRSSSTSSDSPSPALVELQQWDWHGSTRYGVAPASIASLEDVTAWCEAAAAVLRAVPAAARAAVLVAEQGTRAAPRCMLRNPQAASQEPQAASCSPGVLESRNAAEETPAQLAQRCVGLAVAAACSAVHAVGRMPLKPRMKELAVNGRPQPPAAGSTPTVDAAALQAAQHAVWSLHTAAARLAHWACQPRGSGSNSSGAAEAAEAIGGSHDRDGAANAAALLGSWRALPLLRLLNASLGAARLLQSQLKGRSAPDPDLRYDRCMQAMAAAQWPAVQAITADPAVLGQLSRSPADAADLANSLCIAAGCGPGTLALEPELQRLLAQALRCAPQERRAGAAAVWELLLMAENSPRLASALAVTGGLDLIINWLVHTLARQIPFTCDALVLNMGCFILNAVASVRRAGDAVAASAGGGGAATPTLAAVLQAHAGMQQAFPVDDGVQVCVYRIDGELLSRIAGMLPACVQLAAALMAHWREPDQLAASKLEAAQAAAARSCAFLRCASLGGESGPAARQGGFSQRCSACRVAWYCGTACSHANWRAGHRRLCKALGAARQAEKEQRRQAGQPPAG